MGTNRMPTVADFLTIEPVTPELVLEIGYLPQCEGNWESKGCGLQPTFTIEGSWYCPIHKQLIVERWERMIEEWVKRPARAQDSDLELLEIIRDELQPPKFGERYPRFVVNQVVKELSLPNTSVGWNLAAWYLWKMEIFNIHQRVMLYEQS